MDYCESTQSHNVWKYQAFLSFADDDDDDDSVSAFMNDLTAALRREDILTFSSDRRLEIAQSLPPHIIGAIQGSQIYVVVFTKHYADSVWCLQELSKMAQGIGQRIVLPIFYRVRPAKVRKQSSFYQVAFAQHEEKFRGNLDQVQRWRVAMKQVASLRGWRAWIGAESQVIDDIVRYIMRMFGRNGLVGMETRVKAFQELLNIRSDNDNDVEFVGISGMFGIGKTCLAQEVYERIYRKFDTHCFLSNDGQFHGKRNFLLIVQQLHESLMDDDDLERSDPHQRILIWDLPARCRKTLLVIDNVEEAEQLKFLAAYSNWFGRGSRIIITARDESILRQYGVDKIYRVELLNNDEALKLFCRHAFKRDYVAQGYEEFTNHILQYADGLPLAIKSLGSSLLGRSPLEWESSLKKLEEHPDENFMRLLRSSLNSLKRDERMTFLDIACFFNGKDESYVRRILDSCGLSPMSGIRGLQDKSLLNIMNGKIWMHNLIQQAGREIVRQKSHPDPNNLDRVWSVKDFLNLNINIKETYLEIGDARAIVLNPEVLEETPLRVETLSEIRWLRFLIIQNVNFVGELHHLSRTLRYVSWHKYPYTDLPLSFEAPYLVELIMPHSSITQLWKGLKTFPKLTNLELRGSKYLIETPNFKGLPNLERLDLEGCTELLQIDASIADLQKLKFLNFRNCVNLVSIPNRLFCLSSLEMLNLAGCSNLVKYLNFDSRSLLEGKLLSNQYHPFSAKLLSIFRWFLKK